MPQQPTTDELQHLRDQLRAEVSEARGTLKDLHREIREARTLVAASRDLIATLARDRVQAIIEAEVTEQVEALGKVTEQQMRKSSSKVIAEFDKLRDLLLGHERVADGREERSIPELLQDPAILAHAQHAARRNTTEATRE
jgi:Mg2+ and Co2+ transporter CorA